MSKIKIYIVRIEESTGIGLVIESIISAYKTREKAESKVTIIASKQGSYDKVWIEEIEIE